MASKAEPGRQQIRRRLAAAFAAGDSSAVLRERIVGPPSPEFLAWLAQPSRAAAVLLGLIERRAGLTVLLTERSPQLPDHPGQVSFPGGRLQAGETPEAAALREADEEVALAPAQVEILGRLPAQRTVTGFTVTPIVGWIEPAFEAAPDPSEVQAAFEVPLAHLLAPAARRSAERVHWNTRFLIDEYRFESFRIWGATAAILKQFLKIIE